MISPRLMLILAQTMLLMGGTSLIYAAVKLFIRSVAAGFPVWHLYWIVPVAVVFGASKAIFVMRKRMRINIVRLRATEGKLWPWQIYPPQLLVFILAMVLLMNILKRILTGDPVGLAALGAVDVIVAVALLVSSGEYRRSE